MQCNAIHFVTEGGWSECCFDFKFFTSFYKSQTPGDIALIVKKRPRSAAAVAQVGDPLVLYTQ